ncbi:MAG TPA: glycosyltransferase family 4 protein [Candidatus Thermoplasmatota archaeon]|nr:glycosyltransferase family 4 protein [Candidatus Thermoplasmatota archaeon]
MRRRVALTCPWFAPHVGGVESHVASLAEGLSRQGHDVTVLTTAVPGAPAREGMGPYTVVRVPERLRLFATPVTPALAPAIRQGEFDLVHAHTPPPLTSWYASQAAASSGVPFVLTYHCDLEIPRPGGAFVVRAYERTLGARTIARARRVIATTRTYARTSRALWRREPDVVPNPVDERRFHPDVSPAAARARLGFERRRIVLFVGRLTHHKGIEAFVGAARHTPEDVVHLVLGRGPEEARAKQLARPLGAKVRFLGGIAHEELPSFYAAADVAVLASVSRLEAFGIAALEAMATGKPVIASDIPGVREVVREGETGLLARPLDAVDLAQKINAVLSDPERARAMGKRGRALVEEEFAIDKVAARVERVYEKALEGPSRATS